MSIGKLGRWLYVALTVSGAGVAAASCGGGGNSSTFTPKGTDASFDDVTSTPDTGSIIGTGDGGSNCMALTCASQGYQCGMNSDGCGGTLDCGSCTSPAYCGGGGFSKCGGDISIGPDGGPICVPTTCAKLGYDCGPAGDGCGGLLDCGSCTNPQYCGGGGFNKCGGNDGLGKDGAPPCTPTDCSTLGYNCGKAGDGCGGVLDCGTCTDPQYCGGGGFDLCGGNNGLGQDGAPPCTPTTCSALGFDCGVASDGCGGALNCGTCMTGLYCGGGGFDVCGSTGLLPDGGVPCTPLTCASLGYNCGPAGDGCGGQLDCGSCMDPQYCGGGGFGVCGGNNGKGSDGGNVCTPTDCATLGYNCGAAGDGCGGQLDCGTCTSPEYCGGGGFDLCGGNNGTGSDGGNICNPTTCAALGYNCGVAADGCGGSLNCGTCTDPQYCGGGGYDVCGGDNGKGADGGNICTPTTCAALGYNCGVAGDGCGGTLNCGSCVAPQSCGLGGYDVCGPLTDGGSFTTCESGATSVTGFVYDPANSLPIPNALVYVPIGAVQQPETGVNSGTCGCTSPPAFTSTYTNVDGSFTLPNPPSGSSVQIVVQLGKWQITYTENVVACQPNALGHLTLPSQHSPGGAWPPNGNLGYGNIPQFALDTGNVDTMECILRKMGINDAEFVNPVISGGVPTAAGRVHFYQGSIVHGGAVIDGTTPTEASLTETQSVLDAYDAVLFICQGGPGNYNGANGFPNTLGNLIHYTTIGGRAFSTHYHYDLLAGNGEYATAANWTPNANGNEPDTNGVVQIGFPRGATLAQWLAQPGVVNINGCNAGSLPNCTIPVQVVRNDFSGVVAPAQLWMNSPSEGIPLHFTFDTPFVAGGADANCGRVVYSDFHVENSGGSDNVQFPNECTTGLTAQEKLLEYEIFDLTSCVSKPTCTPLTCVQLGDNCGTQGDGCGGTLDCGTCTPPLTCGGGGVNGQCGQPDGGVCTPVTCAQLGINCGPAGDGCGNQIDCGTCVAPQTCGGGGVAGQCGAPDAGACTPVTCASQGITCGPAGDGCGGALDCGTCVAPLTCGGGGVAGQCGAPDGGACVPETCGQQGLNCGPAGDGCGNLLDCGSCTPPQTCGGGGTPGQCGYPDAGSCTKITCKDQGITCGPAGDGCGGEIMCGTCTPPLTCGGGGVHGQCGFPEAGACNPETCSDQHITCGPAGDGCGNEIMCGTCTPPQTCGGGGVSGQCGAPDAGMCTPQSCKAQNISCGPAGDGCGNEIMCGTCTAPETCGGGGVNGQCGMPDGSACKAETCAQQNINCGPAGDGCGNLLQCGTCTGTQTCGGGGTPGQCGGGIQ